MVVDVAPGEVVGIVGDKEDSDGKKPASPGGKRSCQRRAAERAVVNAATQQVRPRAVGMGEDAGHESAS
jgi:hypothetical protein